MEKQLKLTNKKGQIVIMGERKPEIKVIRNTFMTAFGLVKEEVTKKTWFIPERESV
jgi:hypothetical protein